MATSGNYDYDVEAASIERRQKMLDALMQASQAPAEMPQPGGKLSPYSILAKIIQGVNARHEGQRLEVDKRDLANRYRSDLQEGMANFVNTRDGIDEMRPSMVLKPNEDGSLQQVPVRVKGDPKRAMLEAIASNHPVLQKLGMSLATAKPERDPGALTAKDALAHFDPQSVALNPADPSKWARKKDIRASGDQFVDLTEGKPQHLGGRTFSDPLRMEGVGLVQGDNWSGKLDVIDKAPKTNISVDAKTVNSGETSFMKKIGEDSAAMVSDARKAKQMGEQTLGLASKLEQLEKGGLFSGPTANFANSLSAIAQTAGIPVDTQKLANSQEYQAAIAAQVAKILTAGAGIGRSMSEGDRVEYMKQFPQLINTPQGRASIIAGLKDGARKDIDYAERVQENISKRYPEAGNLFEVAPSAIGYPETPAAAPRTGTGGPQSSPLSVEDSLKWLRGGN